MTPINSGQTPVAYRSGPLSRLRKAALFSNKRSAPKHVPFRPDVLPRNRLPQGFAQPPRDEEWARKFSFLIVGLWNA